MPAVIRFPAPGTSDIVWYLYVFVRNGGAWSQQAKLFPSEPNDHRIFRSILSAALSGNTAVVTMLAAATVFVREGTTWSQQARLPGSGRVFGYSVAINFNTIVVGQPADFEFAEHAFVYVRNGTTWSQQARLAPTDTSTTQGFGADVAINGNTLVVTAPGDDWFGPGFGAAYVFRRSGTT